MKGWSKCERYGKVDKVNLHGIHARYEERREGYWVKRIVEKRICVSSARHGWENLQIQILLRECQDFPMLRECARMMGKCILRMDCAGILKRIFCIYKVGQAVNKMEEGTANG